MLKKCNLILRWINGLNVINAYAVRTENTFCKF